jgi:hypothetical protein
MHMPPHMRFPAYQLFLRSKPKYPYNYVVTKRISQKTLREGKSHSVQKNISARPSKKRRRGRPAKIDSSTVVGAADAYRVWLAQFWPKLGPSLLAAKSSEAISRALREFASSVSSSLLPHSQLILDIVRDKRFPTVRPLAQIHFLADSLGGQGFVTPRRSREICAEERSRVRHVIVRREYYIECSCGYAGPALDGACRDCGTGELSWDLISKENR